MNADDTSDPEDDMAVEEAMNDPMDDGSLLSGDRIDCEVEQLEGVENMAMDMYCQIADFGYRLADLLLSENGDEWGQK